MMSPSSAPPLFPTMPLTTKSLLAKIQNAQDLNRIFELLVANPYLILLSMRTSVPLDDVPSKIYARQQLLDELLHPKYRHEMIPSLTQIQINCHRLDKIDDEWDLIERHPALTLLLRKFVLDQTEMITELEGAVESVKAMEESATTSARASTTKKRSFSEAELSEDD